MNSNNITSNSDETSISENNLPLVIKGSIGIIVATVATALTIQYSQGKIKQSEDKLITQLTGKAYSQGNSERYKEYAACIKDALAESNIQLQTTVDGDSEEVDRNADAFEEEFMQIAHEKC